MKFHPMRQGWPKRLPLITTSRQTGLSLVELLIGIAIGLLVMLAAIGSLSFTRVSSLAVTDTVRMQQDASIAMEMIGRQLRQTRAVAVVENPVTAGSGVSIVNYVRFEGITPPGQPIPFNKLGAEVGVFGPDDVDTTPDSFSTSFGVSAIPGFSTTCMGFASANPTSVSSRFDVANGSLRCRASDAGGAAQDVIDNVEDFQVWYGVRDNVLLNIQYLTAAQVPDQNWGSVGSVMVCLRLVGTTPNVPQPPGFVQQGCNGENLPWIGRYRKVYRQVFTLRNPGF
jgi:type IV pilus assembly protein PilW